jgi:hypothetical protein
MASEEEDVAEEMDPVTFFCLLELSDSMCKCISIVRSSQILGPKG